MPRSARYGERYALGAKVTGYDDQTLMNMVYLASRFNFSRRREKLSRSRHAELASLPPDDQDHWLDRAVAERLTIRTLRDALALTVTHRLELGTPRESDGRLQRR